ncbi:helix-turn-helix domain-containing protein [Pseudonocardia asaccharolytica]|uniref:Transcriptional regulator n=1 Tax=Pseudonocardia asaccharolytica DSM 44247 = NBRC 16224 TaxID=1123024 RepID=A0A511D7T1_9PSEU|nr:helix-turn-helix domain-containing protein [Pseudonocardia asaccharolytica]GEL20865.1 transcriptional regulator [Pseudonocardia asaccharolytica DSM 44247 = NBRC 16224]
MSRDCVAQPDPAATDPVARARALSKVFDAVLAGDEVPPAAPRPIISESWRRSLAAHVDPEKRTPPVVFTPDELHDIRATHPLGTVMPLLRSTLVSIADEAMHVMLVTDAEGHILWREGAASLLAKGDRVGLFPGTQWSEDAIGTNAMGTTIAVDAPVQIHSAEHLVRTYHTWTCVAAPVHDPDTGAILGAIDISGPLHTVHPALVQLVSATAQLAENQLRVQLAIADERLRMRNMPHLTSLRGDPGALVTPTGRVLAGEPYGWWPERIDLDDGTDRIVLPNGREMMVEPLAEGYLLRAPRSTSSGSTARPIPALSLRFMGDGSPTLLLNGRSIPLTLRPAEILTALAMHREGLTAEQLALLLYGDDGNQTTVRGEIHRLRGLIGAEVLQTRPYRLAATVDSDFCAVRRAVAAGRVEVALRACGGFLLPRSDAPEIRQLRDELVTGLRRAVLDSGNADLLHIFAGHPLGTGDLEVYDRLVELLPAGDPRRPSVVSRRALLQDE